MLNLFKTLILSTGLAALVYSAPLPVSQDPCAILAGLSQNLTVQHVSNCYKSIEYNSVDSKATLASLYTLYNDFWIFRDSALTPNQALPFTNPPVDIIAGLVKINQTAYTTDFDFHSDLTYLIHSLNDAHCTYMPNCYNSYIFRQPIALYAPVENGVQSIRVFADFSRQELQECEVISIEGTDATAYIQAWADQNTGFSKDAGVRFNNALVSSIYLPLTQTWDNSFGSFALRTTLPESSSVTYNLQCGANGPGKGQAFSYQAPWTVIPSAKLAAFTDKASYVSNVCVAPPPQPGSGQTASGLQVNPRDRVPLIESEALTLYKREIHLKNYAEKQNQLRKRGQPASSLKDLPDAYFVDGNVTAVYQLKSKPSVGILLLPTMEVDIDTEVPAIQNRLALLAQRGVTNIIIDTYGNGGGYVDFASYIVDIFFPTQDKKTSTHLSRFKVTPASTALAAANLVNKTVSTYFDPTSLGDKTTALPITYNPFLTPIEMTINGRTAAYTEEYYLDYNISALDQSLVYPWSGNASKITILTDGQCGSACGMMGDLLVRYGVKAVAVGGYSKKDLSMFSFPGAAVIKLDAIVETFDTLDVPATLALLPYNNYVQVGVIEVYSEGDVTPLEYTPSRYTAAYHLDYINATAINHDQLWDAVAQTAWGI
ncbi:hypothetical protein BGX26_007343 [Mortierella sp. AD094]|nr:hypothetical protein BGX26_007343 [Mortierella sp. AD094]